MVTTSSAISLNHEQQRKIELKCIELEAMLEEQGLTQAEVNERVQHLRTILTEGARQMSQTDDKRPLLISNTNIEAHRISEIEKDTCSIASETLASSISSPKTTSPVSAPCGATPDAATPTKYKKRKRKSRDSSMSSERKKKYSKKSKKKSPSDAREKSHKRSKRDKEKYALKKSSYRKDVKQKKSSDSEGRKKRSKKRSRKHRSVSVRDKSKGRDRSLSTQRLDEKGNGEKKKKRSRSKERQRHSRKRKRDTYHRRTHSRKRSSSSSESDRNDAGAKKIICSEPAQISCPQEIDLEVEPECSKDANEPLLPQNSKTEHQKDEILNFPEPKIIHEQSKPVSYDFGRKERFPEIAPFRIEPRNNFLLREKLPRPFSSPFKRALDAPRNSDSVPKPVEKEDESPEKVEIGPENNTQEVQAVKEIPEDWNQIEKTSAAPEEKPTDSKRGWSSSPSSSSNSSRDGSECSTCSSERSRKYSSSRDRKRRRRSRSASSRSSSSGRHTRSRSPSIPRRRGSPSFLDRRRITSARKRPIPYHRSSPMSSSSESRRYSNNGYSSSDNGGSSPSYSGRSWSRSRSRSDSREYSC